MKQRTVVRPFFCCMVAGTLVVTRECDKNHDVSTLLRLLLVSLLCFRGSNCYGVGSCKLITERTIDRSFCQHSLWPVRRTTL